MTILVFYVEMICSVIPLKVLSHRPTQQGSYVDYMHSIWYTQQVPNVGTAGITASTKLLCEVGKVKPLGSKGGAATDQ